MSPTAPATNHVFVPSRRGRTMQKKLSVYMVASIVALLLALALVGT